MSATGILMNCCTTLIHIFSMVISLIVLIVIIYRLYHNKLYRRHINVRSLSSVFDDQISLILLGNTYLVFFIYHIAWISITMRTFIGDFSLLKDIIYLGDSTFCRIQVGIIFFLTSQMYHSFLLQALYRYFKIIYSSNLSTIIFCQMSLNNISIYILMIIFSWLISFVVLIPAYTTFNVFSYFPEQYHCLISFTNLKGFIYALLVCYLIPVCVILYIYCQLIIYIHRLPSHGILLRTTREIAVIKRILKICLAMSVLGSPTLFFLFHFIITGKTHPLADRVHELGVSISAISFTFGFAIFNSFSRLLPQLPAVVNSNMISLQRDRPTI
ncbi:unnamed protein product [Adineta steineri]|uniref:G-protein coupled receptors family 1 profile domain-containing protein n=2 Tax=Adineta steineri TaxID=433720 RepID=A0A815AP35_9BILA|nr:unnamed protein product [Adineta steineri]CAF3551513.1 unnamed protein product [Adineta steineri]